jgi:hypothetical protein
MYGDTTVTVVLWDDGGTANGGVDRVTETFLINVLPVNDTPDFTTGSDRTILENSGGETVSAWATNITQGAFNETDQNFTFTLTNSCNDCFSTQPYVLTANGDLCYTLSADGSGSVTVWVKLMDDGGTVNGGTDTITHSFTITITDINDPPGYTFSSSPTVVGGYEYTVTTVLEDADYTTTTVSAWAIDFTQGSKFETWQSLSFSLTNTNPTLFSTQPAIDSATGDLTYILAANENGSATVTAVLYDDGGTANGGVDRITETFVITVIPVNDAPTLTTGGDQTVLEDDPPVCIADWVTNINRGADNESSQSLDFTLTTDNPSLFDASPSIELSGATSGYLCFTLAANQYGAATVTMLVKDDSGTANGGFDQITETFIITVTPVNDNPTITTIADQTVYENNKIGPLSFEIGDPDPSSLTVSVASSDTSKILNSDITFGTTNATIYTNTTRAAFESIPLSITIEPLRNKTGTVNVTVYVYDGSTTVNTGFTITLNVTYHDGPGGIGNSKGTSRVQLWMPADHITGLSDGLPVTEWGDISGYGYTMTELANSPVYSSSFINSKPAVVFDGTSNYFEHASALDFKNERALALYAVIKANNGSANQTILARDADGSRSWGCKLNDTEQLSFSIAQSNSDAVTRLGANTISDAYTIVSFLYDGFNDIIDVYQADTNESNTLENTLPLVIGGTGSNLRIGNDGNGHFFDGSIAEIIVYDWNITPVEHILINNYLSSKYDISLSSNDKYTGDTVAAGDFDLDVAGIGKGSSSEHSISMSAGLLIKDTAFLYNDGDYFLVGHNRETIGYTVTNLPQNVTSALDRSWMVHINSSMPTSVVYVGISRDEMGLPNFFKSYQYVLLKRSGPTGPFEIHSTFYGYAVGAHDYDIFFRAYNETLDTGDCITIGSLYNYAVAFNYDYIGNISNDQFLYSDHAVDLTNTSFTIEYWAQLYATGEMYIIGQGPDTWETDKNLNIGFSSTNTIRFGFDATNTVETSTAITDTLWHHYAFAYDQGTREIKIYIDGELDLTSVMPDGYSGSGILNIAKAPGNSNVFIGDLDEVRIWKTIRSADEIFLNMNISLDADETDLHNYWQFSEGDLITAHDKTATGNHLNLTPETSWIDNLPPSYAPGWTINGIQIGYTAVAQTETLGTLSFTGTDLTMNYNYHEGATVVVTKVPRLYADGHTNFGYNSIEDYWVVRQKGDTPFDADFTFTVTSYDSNKYVGDPFADLEARLLWREAGNDMWANSGDCGWTEIAYRSFQDYATKTITFEGIKAEGQFMINFADHSLDEVAGSGKTLDFDGVDDYGVDETNRITLANASFTIEFWAQRSGSYTTNWAIGHSDNAQGLCIGFINDEFVFSYSTNTASSGPYTDSDWHHWAVTFDSSGLTQTVYCDGLLITSNVADAPYSLTGDFYIGCGANQTNHFEGKLDDIRVWTTARTQANIQEYMHEILNGNETDLLANWRMDESWSYKYINDSSDNSIHCVVNGSMQWADRVTSYAWSERTTNEDEPITINAGYDFDATMFSIEITNSPFNGSLVQDNTAKTIVYTPFANFTGTDVFSYQVELAGGSFPITMTVLEVNDAPEIGTINGQHIGINTTDQVQFTMVDQETDSNSITLTTSSSDASLVLNSNISIECASVSATVTADCTATITPNADVTGSLSITITACDPEGLSATRVFELTVNSLPAIAAISDIATTINTAITPIEFTVTDNETADGSLQVSITTSNATILPVTQTQVSNNAGTCTLSLTSTAYEEGTVTIEITVTDSHGFTSTTSFDLTIDDMVNAGYMMSFDGTDDYAVATQTLSLSSHSVEAWIKTSASSWNGIVSTGDSSGKWSQMDLNSSGVLAVQLINSGGEEKSYTGTTVINNDAWHHVAYTYDGPGDTLNLYVDGGLELTSVSVNQALTGFTITDNINIGVDSSGTNFFTGKIDEVRIWGVERSGAEIVGSKDNKIIESTPGLSAYYRFDQNYGTVLYDLTSQNKDCDVNGPTWEISDAPVSD